MLEVQILRQKARGRNAYKENEICFENEKAGGNHRKI